MTINSEDYEAGEALTTKEAIKWMVDGNVAISENVKGRVYYFSDESGFCWVDKDKMGATGSGVHFYSVNATTWRKAILKRKPISWEDAVRAMLDGKRVWDADGDERKIIDREFRYYDSELSMMWLNLCPDHSQEPFYLTPPPTVEKPVEEKKGRRRVSREDAICAMVRDPEQHCWSPGEGGVVVEYKWAGTKVLGDIYSVAWSLGEPGKWVDCQMNGDTFYLDPPEAK